MSIENELVQRYGQDVLKVVRAPHVPPRVAKDKHRFAVVPRRAARGKLVTELRRDGYKANVCRHRVTKEVTANFVFTNAVPAFTKHAHSVMAEIPSRQIRPLYGMRPPPPPTEKPFEIGDRVRIADGIFATQTGKLTEKRGRRQWIVEGDFGKACLQSTSLIRIDPG